MTWKMVQNDPLGYLDSLGNQNGRNNHFLSDLGTKVWHEKMQKRAFSGMKNVFGWLEKWKRVRFLPWNSPNWSKYTSITIQGTFYKLFTTNFTCFRLKNSLFTWNKIISLRPWFQESVVSFLWEQDCQIIRFLEDWEITFPNWKLLQNCTGID